MSFSFSKIGTKLSLAKHLMSKESQLADDPKSLAAILPLLTGADDSTNYELTANGHGGHVGSLTLRSVGAIVTVLLVLAVASTAHARWHLFGRNSGCQQQAACALPQARPAPATPRRSLRRNRSRPRRSRAHTIPRSLCHAAYSSTAAATEDAPRVPTANVPPGNVRTAQRPRPSCNRPAMRVRTRLWRPSIRRPIRFRRS